MHWPTVRLRGGIARGLFCVLLLATVTACATPPPWRAVANYDVRWADVERVTLIPPLVSVSTMSSGDVAQEVQAWSDAANEHAQTAVREKVEELGRRFVPFAGAHGPRPDFRLGIDVSKAPPPAGPGEQSWLLWEAAKEAILRHTYDPTLTFPAQMSDFDYTLGRESRALLDGTGADAFLLMIATDSIPTQDRQLLIGVAGAAALYTGSYGGPGTTPAELVVGLVEAKTGDILYFNRVSMPLADLRDPDANRALIGLALAGLSK
jgi:hypothetical protein